MKYCTEEILAQQGEFDNNVEFDDDDDDDEPEMNIVVDITALNRRPDLKNAIIEALTTGTAGTAENVSDELIVEMINTFPEYREEFNRLFYELDKCAELEGELTYYPSIMDCNNADEMQLIESFGGFRESDNGIAHKYRHLKKETTDIIYGNPKVRQVVCRMNSESITDELVASMVR